MPDLSTIIQMASLPIASIALIISISSFLYERKPLIHIDSFKNDGDWSYYILNLDNIDFIIKNVSQKPAKNIQIKTKLTYNKNTYDIGEYELNYLNPEAQDVIVGVSKRINQILKNLKLVAETVEKRPLKTNGGEELLTINSLKIDDDFKIYIKFEITCNADIRIPKRISTHKFEYNFEISYAKCRVDKFGNCIGVPVGHEDNYIITVKPSNGNWKQ